MTIEVPRVWRSRRLLSRFGENETLKQLPPRRPAEPPAPASPLQWHLVDLERYEVEAGGRTIGFVDVVGAVYVALAGSRYDRSVEATQTLVFEDALEALQLASSN